MNKTLYIGDIHGRTDWKSLANEAYKLGHKIVFLGDYVDSYDIPPKKQVDNLQEIIAFIRDKKNVTALFGNHDYAYLKGISNISGYNYGYSNIYRTLFEDNIDLFDIAYGFDDPNRKYTLVTHAGLTKQYWEEAIIPLAARVGVIVDELHTTLNLLKDYKDTMFLTGAIRGGWSYPGILWSDFTEVLDDPYPDINQIFGHTSQISPTIFKNGDTYLACIDMYKHTASLII